MKKYGFTFIFFCMVMQMQAQDQTFNSNADSDPEATLILDKIRANFDAHPSAAYDFSLQMEFPGQTSEEQSGALVQKGEKFVFKMADQEIYSDTETMWMYDKSINVVQIHDADFGEDGAFMSPSEFINIYNSKDYSYAITEQWDEGAVRMTNIDFKPLDEDSEYFKIRLELKGKNDDISSIKVFAKDGSRYLLTINSIDHSGEYSDDYFVFDVTSNKDIQIENLRID